MRIPSSRDLRRDKSDQSMTSMIDCVFLLLVFFVCASVGQIRESMLGAELPPGGVAASVSDAEKPPLGEVRIFVVREENSTAFDVNGHRYRKFAELRTTLKALAELAPEIPVILDIAGPVPLGDVIDIYDTCREARFQSIHFATGKGVQDLTR